MNVSSTVPPRAVTSRRASATMATGLTVGWAASSSSRWSPKALKPRYVQRLERLRPWRPSSTLLAGVSLPGLEDADQLVLIAIKRPHPRVGLRPHADIVEPKGTLAAGVK